MENSISKKSAHEIWRLAKDQNLNDEETKALYKKNGIIVSKESIDRRHEIADNILKRMKSKKN